MGRAGDRGGHRQPGHARHRPAEHREPAGRREHRPVDGPSTPVDYGLSSQAPPGPIFGLVSALALLRSPATVAADAADTTSCPPGSIAASRTRSADRSYATDQGPRLAGVQLGAAVEGGCVTGLGPRRRRRDTGDAADRRVRPRLLHASRGPHRRHARSTSRSPTSSATPAFHGSVPPTSEAPGPGPGRTTPRT